MNAIATRQLFATALIVLIPIAAHAQGDKGKNAPMTVEQCSEFRSHFSPDSALKGVKAAEVTRMIVLPKAPLDDTGKSLELRVLVNLRGAVDSVTVRGTVSTTYEERLRVTALRWNFKPATYQGCAVPFWVTFGVTA